ncbi:unnamed protein product [Angiostrongylus costaricensis]|uniref:BRCT domain-containing protein n=1 Tax=Angiostrongylus costaricensis TaxID=334426 RepID=A0A0R3PHT3_ANGCS|nr:unnamed protein product [Angiostrongylus costaricensis]
MEISEHRREEGASSPSACSDNSKVALPPNVFVWLPQTCDIELLTRFRAPSPNANFEIVLPSPSIASLDRSFTAPMLEEVLVCGAFVKSSNHSGAFAFNRGPLRSRATPLKCNASMIANSSVDCCIDNKLCNGCYCEIEFKRHAFLQDILNCTAAKCVDVNFSWVFDLEAGGGATLVLPSKSRRRTSYHCKVCIRKRKRRSPLSSAKRWKRSDSMKECLMLLETGSMPSQIIDVTPSLVDDAAVKMEFGESLNFTAMDYGFQSDELDQTVFEDSVSQRSDRSHSPDRLIIVEDLDAEQEQRVPKDIVTEVSSCQMTSVRLAPAELNFENMRTSTEEIRSNAVAVAQLSSEKTGSELADIHDFQVSHVDFQSQKQTAFFPQESVEFEISRRMDSPGSDAHFELSATSIRQPFFDTVKKEKSPVLVREKLRRLDRNKTKTLGGVTVTTALAASKSSNIPTDLESCKSSKVVITSESGSLTKQADITEIVPKKKQGRWRRLHRQTSASKVVANESRSLLEIPYSFILTTKGSLPCDTTNKQQTVGDAHVNAQIVETMNQCSPGDRVCAQIESVDIVGSPTQDAIATPLRDIQSQSGLAVARMLNDESLTKKGFGKGLQSEHKTPFVPSKAVNVNVLPSKRSVRKLNQISLPKSNNDVIPPFTLAKVSETNGCSNQGVDLLLNDTQSQSDLADASITNDKTVPGTRFRRVLEPENEAGRILSEGYNSNVLPSKGSVRKHKQVSLPNSNADVLPPITLAKVPETNECSSERVELLSNDIQSQSDLADAPITNEETVPRKRIRRVFERENKAGCMSCDGKIPNVLPANNGVRKRKQLFVLKLDTPLLTSIGVSETCECSIQSGGTPPNDIQSQSDLPVSLVISDETVTRRRFRRGAQSENKTACVPSKAENPIVLPSKRAVRKHKQLSVSKSNADMTPFSTLAEVSETNECLSQTVEPLSSGIQSQSDLLVASAINDETVTRIGFRSGAQPENETACIPSKAENANVLPSNRAVREHNQLSVSKTNAEVTPPFTVEEGPGAYEYSSDDVHLFATLEEDSDRRSFQSRKRHMELENLPRFSKRKKNDAVIGETPRSMRDTRTSRCVERLPIIRTTRSQAATLNSVSTPVKHVSTSRRQKSAGQKSLATGDVNDDIVLIKRFVFL